jgi:hypothetical protein
VDHSSEVGRSSQGGTFRVGRPSSEVLDLAFGPSSSWLSENPPPPLDCEDQRFEAKHMALGETKTHVATKNVTCSIRLGAIRGVRGDFVAPLDS